MFSTVYSERKQQATVRDYIWLHNLVRCQSLSNPITVLVHTLCTPNILFSLHKILLVHIICQCAQTLIYENIWGRVSRTPCIPNFGTTLSSSCHLQLQSICFPRNISVPTQRRACWEHRVVWTWWLQKNSCLFYFKYAQINSNYMASDETVM
jgi:hypothetical protein